MFKSNITCDIRVMSSLSKIFPDEMPASKPEETVFSALRGETVSFQLAYYKETDVISYGKLSVKSDIEKNIRVRVVELVPSAYPCHRTVDENYLRTKPGMFPDLLADIKNDRILYVAGQWRALWVDVEVDDSIKAGKHDIEFALLDYNGEKLCETKTSVTIYDVKLPKQELIHTEWFHADCIADYYKIDAWSEKHWEYVENFIATAGKRGINMILTPIHTPPLDTAVGGEITTVQLVDVTVTNGAYSFNFDNVKRFIDICHKHGVKYFEMAHLFTQWGATAAPKIVATVDGEYKRIFGWDTPAVGGEYTVFLRQYLAELIKKLKEWGVLDNTYFHISDEPYKECIESYKNAHDSIFDLLDGLKHIDALSDIEFYKNGLIKKPIPANNHIEPFLDADVKGLWTYYCTAQSVEVSNRFMSMPSARNRVIGLQMYCYNIEGFLHWGYNFYNSQESVFHVNPYAVTDAYNVFPSGDSFLVYPGENGVVEESIRLMVLYNALTDMRALKLLESLKGREYVMALINDGLEQPITFKKYPKSDMYFLQLRNLINWEIDKAIN